MAETLEQRAVARCTDEMARASMYFRALRGLYKAETYHGIDFIQLAAWALHDQMIAHLIKVLDAREQAGFWYLVRKREDEAYRLCAQNKIELEHIHDAQKKLATIRDKTHFHLDKTGVRNPRAVWKDAGLKWKEVDNAIDASLRLLCLLHKEIRGEEYYLPYYDGSDATRIAEHASKFGLLSTGESVDPAFSALFDS